MLLLFCLDEKKLPGTTNICSDISLIEMIVLAKKDLQFHTHSLDSNFFYTKLPSKLGMVSRFKFIVFLVKNITHSIIFCYKFNKL